MEENDTDELFGRLGAQTVKTIPGPCQVLRIVVCNGPNGGLVEAPPFTVNGIPLIPHGEVGFECGWFLGESLQISAPYGASIVALLRDTLDENKPVSWTWRIL